MRFSDPDTDQAVDRRWPRADDGTDCPPQDRSRQGWRTPTGRADARGVVMSKSSIASVPSDEAASVVAECKFAETGEIETQRLAVTRSKSASAEYENKKSREFEDVERKRSLQRGMVPIRSSREQSAQPSCRFGLVALSPD